MPFAEGEQIECVAGPPPEYTKWVHPYCADCAEKAANALSYKHVDAKPSLSLLIVDFGEVCVVRQEIGRLTDLPLGENTYSFIEGNVHLWHSPFAAVREALDPVRPVPRLEHNDKGGYRFVVPDREDSWLTGAEYDALVQLFGRPPKQLYDAPQETGTWERLAAPDNSNFPFDVWRYTRP